MVFVLPVWLALHRFLWRKPHFVLSLILARLFCAPSDMHYGDGIMKEEIERARKRAEAASPRKSGHSYQSPLGNGFAFDAGRPLHEQRNPYSRRRRDLNDRDDGGFRIEYEEAHLDMNGGADLSQARRVIRSKEHVVERMKDRRKNRPRERGEPNPYLRRSGFDDGRGGSAETSGCVIM